VGYCQQSDLYSFGLPRGAIPNAGRMVERVDLDENWLELGGHGLSLDDAVRFRTDPGGSLPDPVDRGVTYYARPVDDGHFQLADGLSTADPPGDVVTLATCGECVILVVPMPVEAAIEFGKRVINEAIPAHAVDLVEPYPEIIVITNAELAAWKLGLVQGVKSATLTDAIDAATKRLERWAKGVPVRGAQKTQTPTNKAAAATRAYDDARGWNRHGGL
jgi:hypothetical protein